MRVSPIKLFILCILFSLLQKIAIETRASVNNIVNETHYALCWDYIRLSYIVGGEKI